MLSLYAWNWMMRLGGTDFLQQLGQEDQDALPVCIELDDETRWTDFLQQLGHEDRDAADEEDDEED